MSDLWCEASGSVNLTWMNWAGQPLSGDNKPVSKNMPFTVGAINSTRVFDTNMLDYTGLDLSDTILRVDVFAAGVAPNGDKKGYTHTSFFHPVSLQKASIQDPGLEFTHIQGTNEFRVEATKAVAAWVWLDHPLGVQGYFADNGFWLAAGETRNVCFTVKQDWTGGRWMDDVVFRSIWNNTLTG